jgi:CDP-2,3-bis-(O-geranylgeranyl)-sn-glycerol synthase
MLFEILSIIYFLLPAGLANMAPGLVKKINFLNYPLDFKKKVYGKRLFGNHKTWRGLISGIIMAILIVYIQTLLYQKVYFQNLSLISYSNLNFILLGFLFGAGALIGDCVESFFKRRLGKKDGESLIFFDQTDWIIGSFLFVSLLVKLPISLLLWEIIVGFLLHVIIRHLGFWLKIDKEKW